MADTYKFFKNIVFKDKNKITKAVENFYSFKKRFNGQSVGSISQELFVQIINKKTNVYAKDISRALERRGREEDIALSNNKFPDNILFEDIDNFFNISLKTASKDDSTSSLVIQLTTNYKFRNLLDDYNDNIKQDKIEEITNSEEFDSITKTPLVILLFDERIKKYGIFYFDFNLYKNDIKEIEKRQNRIHISYYIKNKNNDEISKVLYGKNQANAFQRGVWTIYNNKTSKYFIPLIDWSDFNIIDFKYNFFEEGV